MNPKEQAERIIQMFMPLVSDGGLLDERNVKAYKQYKARQCAEKALEMLIEANPTTVKTIPAVQYGNGGTRVYDQETHKCNKAHYKEVLKAIKNME